MTTVQKMIEDNFSKTDPNTFRQSLLVYDKHFQTLSKTINEAASDKDILFFQIHIKQGENIIQAYESAFNSESPNSARCFRFFVNLDNSTSYSHIFQESSTLQDYKDTIAIENQINLLFDSSEEEFFEDGIQSQFAAHLQEIILTHGLLSMDPLSRIIFNKASNEEIVSEALSLLGRIEHHESYSTRLWLLHKSLKANSARIRDSALLALASLDDPISIPVIKAAIQKESCAELREDMENILMQLENCDAWHSC